MTRRRRRWPFVVAALVLLAAIPVGLVLYARWAGDRELAKARAETTAGDPGWQLADLLAARDAAMPPPEQNAAVLLAPLERVLSVAIRRPDLESARWTKEDALPNRLPDPAELANLKETLANIAGPLATVRRAADLPGGCQPIPTPDLATYDINTMRAPQWARTMAYVAMLDAAAGAAADDPPAALRGVATGSGVARAVGEWPSTEGLLVRMAVAAFTARSCERVLAWCEPADGLDRMQDEFCREAAVPMWRAGLRGERASVDVTMENITATGGSGPAAEFGEHVGGRLGAFVSQPRWADDHAAALRMFNRLLNAESTTAARAVLAEIERENPDSPTGGHLMTRLLLSSLGKCLVAAQRHQATQLCAMTAVACERYRRQSGHWPVKLDDLSPTLLPAVPLDPFDGKPLRLARTPEGVVVYSVGEDVRDDSGRPLAKDESGRWVGDVVFRLFDPAHRRKPAQPPAPSAPPTRENDG